MGRPLYKIFLAVVLLLSACGPSKLSKQDLSSQLAAPDNRLQPDISIYHTADSSFIYFSVPVSELMFIDRNDSVMASLSIRYQLHASFETAATLDSASQHFILWKDSGYAELKSVMSVRQPPGGKGVLRVFVKDNYRQKESEWIYEINNTAEWMQQQFILTDTMGFALVRNYVTPGNAFRLNSVKYRRAELWVRCYFHGFPLPAPPFSKAHDPVFSFKADSLFRYTEGNMLTLSQYGIYHFQTDTSLKSGYTIFAVNEWFPEIKSAQQLIEPLRYLTMRKEYDEMRREADPKKAAEEFWLKTGGRNDRSKALIRIYYQRVQEANRRFTSYVEGWKTDRGMIYTIFGPPSTVYRTAQLEQWTYPYGSSSLTFDFRKKGNPFTANDFSLQRREEYDYPWYESVERWRQGNISLR